ncbi:hypothetical protein G7046_g8929 [Stylonectria norvegica]|nr:hypothetical protein G7046_g8929 [Stylonectria norvegica]
MEHAWLDSLSEDWVSQPGSDTSAGQLPSMNSTNSSITKPKDTPSRIPRRTLGPRTQSLANHESSFNVLIERSANDINISTQRLSSRKSQDGKAHTRGAAVSRSVSAATSASVVHNTVQYKSSPVKDDGETPEWKRRLVYGDIQYGEQRDLFCSAAAGLQDMFKPLPSPEEEAAVDETEQHESTMPSSPPGYPEQVIGANPALDVDARDELDYLDDEEALYPNDVTPSPSPRRAQREVKYRLNVDESIGSSQPSPLGGSPDETSIQQGDEIYRDESCLSAPDAGSNTRKTSGQSDTRNEDFSPIMIGKHSDEDGKVDFAPIDLPADQLKQKLEKLRINQMLLDSEIDPMAGFDTTGQEDSCNVENTEEYARNGGFLNLQRGGRSTEGSFRFRVLSPGLGGDTSEMLPEESLQASTPKQFPSMRTETTNPYSNDYFSRSPSMPRAPFPSPEKRQNKAGPSGGSPLKLFGPYDTFTNQTLLRRISQFEEGNSGTPSRQSLGQQERSSSQVEESFAVASSPQNPQQAQLPSPPATRSFSQFGAGDLEGYEFSGDVSYASYEDPAISNKENASPQPLAEVPVESLLQRPACGPSPDEESELVIRRRRNKTLSSSASKHTRTISGSSQMRKSINLAKGAPETSATPKRDTGSEGKRARASPSKDPTPKRRRTLHRTDIAFGREDQFAAVDSAHQSMQSAMGKKRKDARPGEFQLANPNVLAMRSFIRPRTPTPSQRSSLQREQHPFAEPETEPSSDRSKKSPIRISRNENMPLSGRATIETETDRKPSIRTQDFVDQAAQIMAMIRNQVRPPGLASLEESEAENGTPSPDMMDESYQSTKEPFSRPPSREGAPIARVPHRQDDPELINRLKQYQEMSDMGDVITSSLRSMGLAKDAIRAVQEVERQIEESSRSRPEMAYSTDDEVISDPPNIRLSTNPAHNGFSRSPSRDFHSHSSTGSTNRTFPSASSRGSESRKIIMPESVSHLIPDRVGGMYLDKQNNIWIKKRESRSARSSNTLPSDDSEDDPFASIPDLSVDVTKEMQHLLLTTAQKAQAAKDSSQVSSPVSPSKSSKVQPSRGYVTLSPNGQLSPDMASLARGEFEKLDARFMQGLDADMSEDMEFEVSISEDKFSNPTSTTRRRNLTISFSSPVASIIRDVVAEDLDSLEDDPEVLDEDADTNTVPTPKKSPGYPSVGKSALKNFGHGSMRGNRVASRHLPSNGPTFLPRPVSRIDEQDEEATIELPLEDHRQISIIGDTSIINNKTPDARRTSLSFIVNRTPGNKLVSMQADDSAMMAQNIGKLSLSPLSEFTMNNSDQSFGFEVSYVMGQRHMATGDGSKKVLSMSIRELVDKLSEVEPFEPYWEDITELDLHEKRLGSLHMLDEFCGRLVTLDVSKNGLGHLEGVPCSVRQLKVSQNMLTELTAWDHLMNLQYLDISGNEVKSLSALKNLVHLRSIKADNNQLTSLDGLDLHDGLLSLRARDNLIEVVDFAGIKMNRLTELDLGGNRITSVRNLELLPSLARLRLTKNRLESFAVKNNNKTLRQLDLSDNQLTSLDISNLPNLHSLHADRNSICDMSGFSRARRLDSLSLREQQGSDRIDLSFLSTAYEIRKLFLSGNYLGDFTPTVDFLNLQLLELANCGLQALPENLGQLMPNLRTLNLNLNAIRDLSPLRFIPRLKKLLAVGNRLADSTSVTELLTEFPHLTQLDLRDNPVTMGFYPHVQVLVGADCNNSFVDPFMLPAADVERDGMYASRLDEATKLRRRLHQIVFVASCKRLRTLDGLPVQRQGVLFKDSLFQVLVAEGLLPDETLIGEGVSPYKDIELEEAPTHRMDSVRSSRWNAEDSFA